MLREDVSDEEVHESPGGQRCRGGDKDRHLGEAVDDDEDGIMAIGDREFLDEIHRDRGPRAFRDRERLEDAIAAVSGGLGAAARVTGAHVFVHKAGHAWPVVVPPEELQRLRSARVSGGRVVVAEVCEAEVQVTVIRYNQAPIE